ncbi:MAG TPA: glycosyltransferase [Cytophagaceae bacterium]|jgi:glycosyltransferase involved in cell wall biosynthesis
MPEYSIIIPVYNRPAEVKELLESLVVQSAKNFEIIVVEDGSSERCDDVVKNFSSHLDISYYYKPNSGPGDSRNYGISKCKSDFFIFFDSDCIIPPHYFQTVNSFFKIFLPECYGGPDRAHPHFTPLQKAISYTMTSLFTTGGIRGGKTKGFHPRSFNMGFSRKVFDATNGYSKMRFGEDVDLSLRIEEAGFNSYLIEDAYVFHKRRTDFKKFYKQIYNSGIARINLHKRHPGSLKLTHFFPAMFVSFSILSFLATLLNPLFVMPLAGYTLLIFFDSSLKNRSIRIGFLSVQSLFVQMFAYGLGFMKSFWRRIILGKDEFSAFEKNFYK